MLSVDPLMQCARYSFSFLLLLSVNLKTVKLTIFLSLQMDRISIVGQNGKKRDSDTAKCVATLLEAYMPEKFEKVYVSDLLNITIYNS